MERLPICRRAAPPEMHLPGRDLLNGPQAALRPRPAMPITFIYDDIPRVWLEPLTGLNTYKI